MTSKLIEDTFRPPKDPFVELGVFDAPLDVQPSSSSSQPSAAFLLEAHRLVEAELSKAKEKDSGTDQKQQQQHTKSYIEQQRAKAADARQDFARVRTELVDLFGARILGDAAARDNDGSQDENRRNRRVCVESEIFVGAFARILARQRRRQRDSDGAATSQQPSVLEHALDLPAGSTAAMAADSQRWRVRSATARRQLMGVQAMRRDLREHVAGSVLPSLKRQKEVLVSETEEMRRQD